MIAPWSIVSAALFLTVAVTSSAEQMTQAQTPASALPAAAADSAAGPSTAQSVDRTHAPNTSVTESSRAWLEAAQKKLSATFTQLQFERVRDSELPGVVEIYAGPRILYYAPEQEILILGELYDTSGVSLTERKLAAHTASKAHDLDRAIALAVGQGPKEIIAFVDPDCGYCKAAYHWMREQKFDGVKELIYFMPLKGRAAAESRALNALCVSEEAREDALRQVFDGFDGQHNEHGPAAPLRCKEGLERLAAHAEMARKLGVYATPYFLVKDQAIAGFDRQRLAAVLASN